MRGKNAVEDWAMKMVELISMAELREENSWDEVINCMGMLV